MTRATRMVAFLVFLCLFALPALSAIAETGNPADPDESEPRQELDARLVSLGVNPHSPEIGEIYKFTFGEYRDRVPLVGVATPHAMRQAAVLFALDTGASTITVQDIVDNGYWPYNVFAVDFDYSQEISAWDEALNFHEELVKDIGSTEWVLCSKNYILGSLYNEYYYFGGLGCPEEAMSAEPVLPAELKLIDAFWVSPVTGEPFAYGEARGEISETAMVDIFTGMPCLLPDDIVENSALVYINTRDLMPIPKRVDGRIVIFGPSEPWHYYVVEEPEATDPEPADGDESQ